MRKGQRPSRHIRRIRTKRGIKAALVNPSIRKNYGVYTSRSRAKRRLTDGIKRLRNLKEELEQDKSSLKEAVESIQIRQIHDILEDNPEFRDPKVLEEFVKQRREVKEELKKEGYDISPKEGEYMSIPKKLTPLKEAVARKKAEGKVSFDSDKDVESVDLTKQEKEAKKQEEPDTLKIEEDKEPYPKFNPDSPYNIERVGRLVPVPPPEPEITYNEPEITYNADNDKLITVYGPEGKEVISINEFRRRVREKREKQGK